ncbi:MAG TPA: hypothetical protein VF677_12490 [Flavobacterium sp.]|jgi:hypothetical protein
MNPEQINTLLQIQSLIKTQYGFTFKCKKDYTLKFYIEDLQFEKLIGKVDLNRKTIEVVNNTSLYGRRYEDDIAEIAQEIGFEIKYIEAEVSVMIV